MKSVFAFLIAAAALAAVPVPARASDAPFVGHRVTRKLHRAACEWAKKISDENRIGFATWKEARSAGYVACGKCKPDVEEVNGSAVDAPFVGNRNSRKLHRAGCELARNISLSNRIGFKSWKEAEAAGYTPCGGCKPDASAPPAARDAGAAEKPAPAPAASSGSSSAPAAPAAVAEAPAPVKPPAADELCASRTGKTFHKPDCEWAKKISAKNMAAYKTRDEAVAAGKNPCRACKP